jgi:hypothetical protein
LNTSGQEEQALVFFDRARSGCDRDVASAERDAADLNDGVRATLAASVELVGVARRDDLDHVGVVFQACPMGPIPLARELEQAAPLIEEARAIAEVPAEREERIELAGGEPMS